MLSIFDNGTDSEHSQLSGVLGEPEPLDESEGVVEGEVAARTI